MDQVLSLLIFPIVWIVTAAGRTFASLLRLPETAARLERNLIGFALGLGVLAYGILVLGLLHLLYPLAGLLWMVVLLLAGGKQHLLLAQDFGQWRPKALTVTGWLAAALLFLFGLAALTGVYAPPVVFIPGVNATEWDSLSYHLADPKLFLGLHHIVSFPWQPHSNFAFTAEMWYTLALMAKGCVPLAKWFSWLCFAGTILGAYGIGRRVLSAPIGLLAAVLLAATPLAFWEAGTAYIDGATAFFATWALLCLLVGFRERRWDWLRVGAVLAGFALSTKASAIAFLLVLALGVLVWHWHTRKDSFGRALGYGMGWGALAVAVGSPWYIKSWIATGNPIYPYFYSVFGGRWWNHNWAIAYAGANNPGAGHGLDSLIVLPWNLTMALVPGHVLGKWPPFNEFPSSLAALLPVLLAALFVPFFASGKVPRAIAALAAYAVLSTLLWYTQTQYIRFLLPMVPVYCLLAAWVVCETWEARTLCGRALGILCAVSLVWSLTVAFALVRLQAPVATGAEPQSRYIARYDSAFGAMHYINTQLPAGAKIALFGHPLGFYCDRSYLWADQSTYVLTPQVHSPQSLLARLHQLGVTDILVDTRNFPLTTGGGVHGWLNSLVTADGPPLYPTASEKNDGVYVYALR